MLCGSKRELARSFFLGGSYMEEGKMDYTDASYM